MGFFKERIDIANSYKNNVKTKIDNSFASSENKVMELGIETLRNQLTTFVNNKNRINNILCEMEARVELDLSTSNIKVEFPQELDGSIGSVITKIYANKHRSSGAYAGTYGLQEYQWLNRFRLSIPVFIANINVYLEDKEGEFTCKALYLNEVVITDDFEDITNAFLEGLGNFDNGIDRNLCNKVKNLIPWMI